MGSVFWLDFRHTLRALRRAPGYALITIAVLALGIGANAGMFSLARAVVFKPLPFADAEQLVSLNEGFPKANFPFLPFNAPDFSDLRELSSTLGQVEAFQSRDYELSGLDQPASINGTRVTPGLFRLLGISPALGRGFTEEEDVPGSSVAILSFDLWQNQFAGNPDILDQVVQLDRKPYTVVGVMPMAAPFPLRRMPLHGEPADVFLPMGFSQREIEGRGMMHNLGVIGRLAPGATLEQAQSEMTAMGSRIQQNYPDGMGEIELVIEMGTLRESVLGKIERPLMLLLGAMSLVLLVVCANLANLALARSMSRRSEIALRSALGASRRSLLLTQVLEGGLLAVVGGVVGVLGGQAALTWALSRLPAAVPFAERVRLDGAVLAFSLGLTALAVLLSSVLPSFFTNKSVAGSLKAGSGRSAGERGQQRLQQSMVVATVGLAMLLLVGAGLLLRSFQQLMAEDAGFSTARVLTMELTLPNRAYPEASRVLDFASALEEKMESIPGVKSAFVSSALPMEANERRGFAPEDPLDSGARFSVTTSWVSPTFFDTLGVELIKGRTFEERDRRDSAPVVVVSSELARRTWGTTDVVGKRLRWRFQERDLAEVVGVVGEVNDGPLGSEANPHLYIPYEQFDPDELDVGLQVGSPFGRVFRVGLASLGQDPSTLTRMALAGIGDLDASIAVSNVSTLKERVDSGLATQRFGTTLVGGFAIVALLIAGIGLYGVLAYGVAQRRKEIGIRLALGARPGQVVGLILGQGLKMTVMGLAVGLAVTLAFGRVMSAVLYETSSNDVVTLAVVVVVLLAATLLASWLPARRASKIDPITTLRPE